MNRISAFTTSQSSDTPAEAVEETLACVLSFNASDPSGAGGIASDALVIASIGAHALPVVTGAYIRDTRETFGHLAFDDAAIADQARLIAEDVPLQTIKVGFLGSPEAVSAVAAFTADYADVPVIAYMPDLSWWTDDAIDAYLDAFAELLLPQTTVLVGNNSTLRHWLLPESATRRHAPPTALAHAAGERGVPYVLITGLADEAGHLGNVLAAPQAVLCSASVERIEATFVGAGDTLSAALAALLATGSDLTEAAQDALQYLDHSLDHGFHPGMGHAVGDRLFWAQSSDPDDTAAEAGPSPSTPTPISISSHDTKH